MLSVPLISANVSPLGWMLALAAAVAYAVPAAGARRISQAGARIALRLAWVLHALALAWGLLGEQPHFGFAPALSMTAWLVLTVYGVEQQLFPKMRAQLALSALGTAAVLMAALFPGTPLHVNASPWLPLHLALGIASYGLFAAAVVHASLMTRAEQHMRLGGGGHDSGLPLLTLERLTFRFVSAAPCACSMQAPCCCCWPMRDRASSWKCCWSAPHEVPAGPDRHHHCRRRLAQPAPCRGPRAAPGRCATQPGQPCQCAAGGTAGHGRVRALRPAPAAQRGHRGGRPQL